MQAFGPPQRNPTGGDPPLVVHVFPTFAVGGAQVRFAALANQFGPAFRHLVVALDGNLACRERLRADLDVQFPCVEAPKDAMLTNAWRFRGLLRRWRPDVLVTCNWGAIEFALANLLPVARHLHVVDGFGPEERSSQIPRRVLVRRLALTRSLTVLPSRNLVRIATEVWKLPPNRVRYVPNGIDLERFATPRTPRPGPVVIGTVAALRPEKNLARLLRAFARLSGDFDARLVIVGDGAERAALTELAAALNVAERVTFTGHRDDTPELYAGFDVFALSSDTEQMPLSVLEAMGSGLAVVATDVGDVRSMLAVSNAPFVVPLVKGAFAGELMAGATMAHATMIGGVTTLDTETDDVMAAALGGLLRDAGLRTRIGADNRTKARRDFDQSVMFDAYRALWTGSVPAA